MKAAPIGDHPVLQEEAAFMANAIEHRRQEFVDWPLAGARRPCENPGLPDAPIPMQRLRNPLWPPSILGAISHDDALCAVALLHNDPPAARSIGLDLISLSRRAGRMEELAPMFVADEAELRCVAKLSPAADPYMLLFGLKECVIKSDDIFARPTSPTFGTSRSATTDGFDIHLEGSVTRAQPCVMQLRPADISLRPLW